MFSTAPAPAAKVSTTSDHGHDKVEQSPTGELICKRHIVHVYVMTLSMSLHAAVHLYGMSITYMYITHSHITDPVPQSEADGEGTSGNELPTDNNTTTSPQGRYGELCMRSMLP